MAKHLRKPEDLYRTTPLKLEAKDYRARILMKGMGYNPDTYEYDSGFKAESNPTFLNAHTVMEMHKAIKDDSKIQIEGNYLALTRTHDNKPIFVPKRFKGREAYLKAWESGTKSTKIRRLFESSRLFEDFATGGAFADIESTTNDFTPLMGGPFFKQLYQHDYMRMHSACFFAYHHDPIAKAYVNIVRDFVLGRGFRIDSDHPTAMVIWEAFEILNDFPQLVNLWLDELHVYGENMLWFLPQGQKAPFFNGAVPPQLKGALIPRVTLIDPSCIWDIITLPEDIRQVVAYQWVAPTQYQTYTAPGAPGSKFIFQQIAGQDVLHTKINAVSNEKRGRSDLFAVLGYLKRLRDANNYSILGALKASAWSIDTSIEGSQEDIDAYFESQQALGTIPPAGSEFVHSNKIIRNYLGNTSAAKGGNSNAFEWCLSMICAGLRVPISYFGTHLSGGQTRASALVATEPVAKLFESRQILVERMIKRVFKRVTGQECEITFPELITQDRSAKIRDIVLAYNSGFISKERCAELVTKELNITEFDWAKEMKKIASEGASEPISITSPLSAPPKAGPPQGPDVKTSGLPSDEKRDIKKASRNAETNRKRHRV